MMILQHENIVNVYVVKDRADDGKSCKFKFRLDIEYDEWMKSKHKYAKQFRYEMSKILKVRPNLIKLEKYEKGSIIFVMVFLLYKLEVRRWLRRMRNQLIEREIHDDFIEEMKVQDQIEVKYQNRWYNATIVNLSNDTNGRHFKVCYNPINNSYPFSWRNTEWFYSKNNLLVEDDRLRYPGKILYKNEQGENVCWKAPEIEPKSIYDIQVNDHVFVREISGEWRRGNIYFRAMHRGRVTIDLRELVDGKTYRLELWKWEDLQRISFDDKRYVEVDVNTIENRS